MILIACVQICMHIFSFFSFSPLDLEMIFRNIDTRRTDSGMSYRALRKHFGTTIPNGQTMKCFDTDGNRRYTLAELKSATGLWATPSLRSGEQYWNTRKKRVGGLDWYAVVSLLLFWECCTWWTMTVSLHRLGNGDSGMPLPTHSKFTQNPWPHQRKPRFPGNRRKWILWNCQCYFSCSIVELSLMFAPYFHVLI